MVYHMISTVGSRLKAMEQQNGGITIKFKRVQDLHTTESVEGALEKSSYAVNERKIDRRSGALLMGGIIEQARAPERMLQATAEKGVGVKACPGGKSKGEVIMAAVIPTKTSRNRPLRDLHIEPGDKNKFMDAVIQCSADFPPGSRRSSPHRADRSNQTILVSSLEFSTQDLDPVFFVAPSCLNPTRL